tara:strand:- start:2150 stop:2452 length:303 start_codon:yes stop_codon:yes gene_type:complete
MVGSILLNYFVGKSIHSNTKRGSLFTPKNILFIGISINLLVLFYFKYAYFIAENLSILGINITIEKGSILLPIGISFYTFQSISYLIDVYKKMYLHKIMC